MTPVLRPTSELAGIAWVQSIHGLTADVVATQLPDESQWLANGAVVLRVIGGSPAVYLPVAAPVFQLDFYASKEASDKPPWGRANLLAEQVRAGCHDQLNFSRVLNLSSNGKPCGTAVAEDATLLTEPRRGYADRADWALYTADLRLTWKTVSQIFA